MFFNYYSITINSSYIIYKKIIKILLLFWILLLYIKCILNIILYYYDIMNIVYNYCVIIVISSVIQIYTEFFWNVNLFYNNL